ncbi:uracil-DNA glycosylase, family 4 [Geobacter sp. DSM 9736]|nr:uracil-DNA glycosylase, family 4 [Geobacter sp. DSM 9736]
MIWSDPGIRDPQAPSENGIRKSGTHWIGEDGQLRRPGGFFLDKYLKRVGYSVNPEIKIFARPYTTNVLHCWTGRRNGRRDRQPTAAELQNCKPWWHKEIEFIRPRVVILLGKPAAESFSAVCGDDRPFKDLIVAQGEWMQFGDTSIKRYVLPHPTAPYPEKSAIYSTVFKLVSVDLK